MYDKHVHVTCIYIIRCNGVVYNRDINLSAPRLLLLSVIRPSTSEVWDGNKGQTNALEPVVLGESKKILGCSSKTCNGAVRGGR